MGQIDADLLKVNTERKAKLAKAIKREIKKFRHGYLLADFYIKQGHLAQHKDPKDFYDRDPEEALMDRCNSLHSTPVTRLDSCGLFDDQLLLKADLAGAIAIPGEKYDSNSSTVPDVVVRIDAVAEGANFLHDLFQVGDIIWGWEYKEKLEKLLTEIE